MGVVASVVDKIPAIPTENKTTETSTESPSGSEESSSESDDASDNYPSSDTQEDDEDDDDEEDDDEKELLIPDVFGKDRLMDTNMWKIEILDGHRPISPDSLDDSDHSDDSEEADVQDTDESLASDYSDNSSDPDEEVIPQKEVIVKPKVNNSWKEKELKELGIKFVFTNRDDANAMGKCEIVKWSGEKRNDKMEDIKSKEEFFASDIFQVKGPELHLKDGITVIVTLAKSISKRHKVKVKQNVDGVWIKQDASFKGMYLQTSKAEFKTKRLQHFVIVGALETKKVKVSPEGTKFKVDETSKLEVDIPAGAVDSDQDINFQIIPPDATAMKKYMRGEKPICQSIIGVTECVYGDNPTIDLKKPINVKLPFEERQDKVADTTVVPFEMVGKEIKMMDPQTNVGMSDEGVCNIQVSHLRGYFAAAVRNDCLKNRKMLERDVRLLFGTDYVANILMFREKVKMPTGFPKIWIQIVDKVDVEKVVEKRKSENDLIEVHNSRSPDITVFDGFRLRIDIQGNLQGLRGIPKNHYLITYLDVSDDNHKVFTVEKRMTMDVYGSIRFCSDKGSKLCVHSIDFDPIVGFKRAYRSDKHADRRPIITGVSVPGGEDISRLSSEVNPSTTTTTQPQETYAMCPALNDASLFNMADMMVEEDDGLKLSIHLGMSDDFENISQTSQSQRAAIFKLLKEWMKKQTNKEEAVEALNKGLIDAKFTKVADVFMHAVRNDDEI